MTVGCRLIAYTHFGCWKCHFWGIETPCQLSENGRRNYR